MQKLDYFVTALHSTMCLILGRCILLCVRKLLILLGCAAPKTHADSVSQKVGATRNAADASANSIRELIITNSSKSPMYETEEHRMSIDGGKSLSDGGSDCARHANIEFSKGGDGTPPDYSKEEINTVHRDADELKSARLQRTATLHLKAAQMLAGGAGAGNALTMARAARLFALAADGFTKCAEPQVSGSSQSLPYLFFCHCHRLDWSVRIYMPGA